MSSVDRRLDPARLLEMAGDGSFDRGSKYAADGKVVKLNRDGNCLDGPVAGTSTYRVELRFTDGEMTGACDCPVGERGAFCKHCVAVALVAAEAESGQARPLAADRLRDHLESCSKPDLVGTLLKEAGADPELFDRLVLWADTGSGNLDLDALGKTIRKEVKPRGFIEYYKAREHTGDLNRALDSFDLVLDSADPVELVKLIEKTSRWIESTAGKMDDSD